MKKNQFSLLLSACLVISFCSCKKATSLDNSIDDSLTPTLALLKKIQRIEGTQGGVTISTGGFFSNYNPNAKRTFQVDGSFSGLPFENIKIGEEVNLVPLEKLRPGVSSNQYIPDDGYASTDKLANLFGKKINISYTRKVSSLQSRFDQSIDTPDDLNGSVSGGSGSSSNFYRNVPVSWSAGNSNDKVYVLMMFMPSDISNERFQNYQKVTKFYEVPDNGSYTLTEGNFSGIPQGAYVLIVIARGTTALGAASVNGTATSITTMSTTTISGQVGSGGGGGTGGGGGGSGLYIL